MKVVRSVLRGRGGGNIILLPDHRVSQQTFDVVLSHLGAQGLVELTTLMGFYAMLAFNANAVDLDMPATTDEPPLPV